MKKLVFALAALAAGAGVAYLFDPRQGSARRERLKAWVRRRQPVAAPDDDGLAPFDLTPQPAAEHSHNLRSRALPALAVAAPVAVAVGAAWLRQRENGDWLH